MVKQWVIGISGNRHGAPSDGKEAQTESFPLVLYYLFTYIYIYKYIRVSLGSQFRDSVTPALRRVGNIA